MINVTGSRSIFQGTPVRGTRRSPTKNVEGFGIGGSLT
jgi:hypothetical protein